jgi:hypothetical protein
MRAADYRSGAYSILTGVAANHSMAKGEAIEVVSLVQGVGYPDYPQMPDAGSALPLLDKK